MESKETGLSSENLKDFTHGYSREWLETNGIGGYASSSYNNCHFRRYHALLAPVLEASKDRLVVLSNLEEVIELPFEEVAISTQNYQKARYPEGWKYLQGVSHEPCMGFTYAFGEYVLHKELMLLDRQNTLMLRYFVESPQKKALPIKITPLIANRNIHHLRRHDPKSQLNTSEENNCYVIEEKSSENPPLYLRCSGTMRFEDKPDWYYDFYYEEEEKRGFDCIEDLMSPGSFTAKLTPGKWLYLTFSLEPVKRNFKKQWEGEFSRRVALKNAFPTTEIQEKLWKSSTQFIKHLDDHSASIIAGYPWFEAWGRDAMIALPGLTLCTGQHDLALKVLNTYAQEMKDGIIPNFLGLNRESNAYNSVDASLWFAWAVQKYLEASADVRGIEDFIWPALKECFTSFHQGTKYQISCHENGLLWAGSEDHQLTWMDAQVEGKPVTPRWGYAVEINALWYNTLCFLSDLAQEREEEDLYKIVFEVKERTKKTFESAFWNAKDSCLYDCIQKEDRDSSIRPNQIFAVSLAYSPLSEDKAKLVVETVKRELYTPYGLRTLSFEDADFIGTYEGSPEKRDRAYHNGTVWPWLIGAYAEASIKVFGKTSEVYEELNILRKHLHEHLSDAGVGMVSEIFDGAAPHKPRGCISQAWSVAELIRLDKIMCEEAFESPRKEKVLSEQSIG
ncbi:MAG: putative glycogen debranching enzyme [Chlamydiales bacterium]|jgi:predicted glycogen debranching enzyme